jgi:hypothetical protein
LSIWLLLAGVVDVQVAVEAVGIELQLGLLLLLDQRLLLLWVAVGIAGLQINQELPHRLGLILYLEQLLRMAGAAGVITGLTVHLAEVAAVAGLVAAIQQQVGQETLHLRRQAKVTPVVGTTV